MKTKSLIFTFVSLSLSFTALSVRAANNSDESEPVQLPAYVVKADRPTSAEKKIDRSLQQLRALATKPLAVEPIAPLLQAQGVEKAKDAQSSTVVVAGL